MLARTLYGRQIQRQVLNTAPNNCFSLVIPSCSPYNGRHSVEGRHSVVTTERIMTTPISASNAPTIHQSLRALQMASQKFAGPLQSNEFEIALLQAIKGEVTSAIGPFQVYMDTSRDDRVTVFVHNPSEETGHKYVIASTDSRAFVVATPISWTPFHKNIVARIMAATGQTAHCSGGGFVSVEGGKITVEGASTDFGEGDHATAKAALLRAFKNAQPI